MTEEQINKLEKNFPGLMQGINEDDVNKYIIETQHRLIMIERRFEFLATKTLLLIEENTILRDQLTKVEPLLRGLNEESSNSL